MQNKVELLDHGFIRLTNLSGPIRRPDMDFDADDTDPANSARMSFLQMDKTRLREKDLGLADYLMRNKHTSPFEMIECWFEMKMPIFLARQFIRHRTATVNEVSGRYVTLPAEWYIPETVGMAAEDKKQGQAEGLPADIAMWFKESLALQCQTSYDAYLFAIDHKVAPEHARLMLHLNHYTHWIWKQDLHNLMHLMSLRVDSHAQIEAQDYAVAMIETVRQYLPHSMELFDKYRRLK